MSDKKAFVFDTNFIVKYKRMDEVVKKLENDFELYITQLSIDERASQHIRDDLDMIDQAEKLQADNQLLFEIKLLKDKDSLPSFWKKRLQKSYKKCIKNIIPYSINEEMFRSVLGRANAKKPPFSAEKGASDKGFKDCILWLSLLDYFKSNGENEVLFITNDTCFTKNSDYLEKEFKEATNKTIEIKSSSYYDDLCRPDIKKEKVFEPTIPNLDTLRNSIYDTIDSLRGIEYYDQFGNYDWEESFYTSKMMDKEYICGVFSGLTQKLNEHIFEKEISAINVLELDNRIENGSVDIPINKLEEALKLYNEIKAHYPEYLDQFYEAVAKVLNKNYRGSVTPIPMDIEDDLPF